MGCYSINVCVVFYLPPVHSCKMTTSLFVLRQDSMLVLEKKSVRDVSNKCPSVTIAVPKQIDYSVAKCASLFLKTSYFLCRRIGGRRGRSSRKR